MESGYRAACNRYEQDREKRSQALVLKSGKCRKIHSGMRKDQSQHCPGDHSDKHKCGHKVSGLHHKPHRKYSRQENIGKCNVYPHILTQEYREIHTKYKCQDSADQSENNFFPSGKLHFVLDYAKYYCEQDKEQGYTSRRSVYLSIFGKGPDAVRYCVRVKGICHHVGKCGDNNQAEQPAEAEEQLPACSSDVLFNEKPHGFSVILYAGIQRSEVSHSSEENTSQYNPKKNRQPSECSRLDRTCDRAGSRDGRKLMGKYSPSVCRHIVLSVVTYNGGGFGTGVYSPFFRQPAAVQSIGGYEAYSGDQYDYKCVHNASLSF